MTKLADLQSNFIKDCLSGTLTANNISMATELDTRSISAQGLMGIYQHSAIANITSSLSLTYPVVEKLVGKDFFAQVSRQYIFIYWPTTANMDDYGENFPLFVAELEQAKSLTYLKDVAQLEWLFHQCSLAKDSITFDWTLLAKVAPADALQLNFILAPSVALIKSTQPIDKIWQMNQENVPDNSELALDGDNETNIVLFKQALKTQMITISASEFALLQSFAQGHSFEMAIERVMANTTMIEADSSIDNILKKYIALGVICGFSKY
ncbi:DNA-binding domain-containing protein [Colwellia piezophila]|uniref:HvfC/BufC N-terminal domain-containing protein n=1 Tax=Colwellia piezophila TaxID=211668 RepID=UPI000373A227|nr:DNA-binding domain-containing protein [Colwellia piezophila]